MKRSGSDLPDDGIETPERKRARLFRVGYSDGSSIYRKPLFAYRGDPDYELGFLRGMLALEQAVLDFCDEAGLPVPEYPGPEEKV